MSDAQNLYNRNKQVYTGLNIPKKKPNNVVRRALDMVNYRPFSPKDVKTGIQAMYRNVTRKV